MPRIKILGNGLDKMTGDFGGIRFTEGVSDENVSRRDADRLGAILPIVDFETGEQVNVNITLKRARGMADAQAKVADEPVVAEEPVIVDEPVVVEEPVVVVEEPVVVDEPVVADEPVSSFLYTEAQIVDAADQGIEELRKLATPHGIKGNSIVSIVKQLKSLKA